MHLEFIRLGCPVDNSYIESLNGRLRDECLNVEVFFALIDARRKMAFRLHDYDHLCPHSALANRTSAESAIVSSGVNDRDETTLEDTARLPHFHRTAAAASDLSNAPLSRLSLETIT